MSKTLTKEQLAAKLDKWEYGKCIPKETIQRTMKIGLDLDGTITQHPQFFSKLSHLWVG